MPCNAQLEKAESGKAGVGYWKTRMDNIRGSHIQGVRLGVTNVGEKPTFNGLTLTVETFIPDFEADLYGAHLELGFLHRLRPERRFPSIDALRAQIAEDVILALAWWADHPRASRHR